MSFYLMFVKDVDYFNYVGNDTDPATNTLNEICGYNTTRNTIRLFKGILHKDSTCDLDTTFDKEGIFIEGTIVGDQRIVVLYDETVLDDRTTDLTEEQKNQVKAKILEIQDYMEYNFGKRFYTYEELISMGFLNE